MATSGSKFLMEIELRLKGEQARREMKAWREEETRAASKVVSGELGAVRGASGSEERRTSRASAQTEVTQTFRELDARRQAFISAAANALPTKELQAVNREMTAQQYKLLAQWQKVQGTRFDYKAQGILTQADLRKAVASVAAAPATAPAAGGGGRQPPTPPRTAAAAPAPPPEPERRPRSQVERLTSQWQAGIPTPPTSPTAAGAITRALGRQAALDKLTSGPNLIGTRFLEQSDLRTYASMFRKPGEPETPGSRMLAGQKELAEQVGPLQRRTGHVLATAEAKGMVSSPEVAESYAEMATWRAHQQAIEQRLADRLFMQMRDLVEVTAEAANTRRELQRRERIAGRALETPRQRDLAVTDRYQAMREGQRVAAGVRSRQLADPGAIADAAAGENLRREVNRQVGQMAQIGRLTSDLYGAQRADRRNYVRDTAAPLRRERLEDSTAAEQAYAADEELANLAADEANLRRGRRAREGRIADELASENLELIEATADWANARNALRRRETMSARDRQSADQRLLELDEKASKRSRDRENRRDAFRRDEVDPREAVETRLAKERADQAIKAERYGFKPDPGVDPLDPSQVGGANFARAQYASSVREAEIKERSQNVAQSARTRAGERRLEVAVNRRAQQLLIDESRASGERTSLLQQMQARQNLATGGTPRAVGDFQGAKSLVGGAMLTSARYAASGAILYGGARTLGNLGREIQELDVAMARLEGQFNALGKAAEFPEARRGVLELARTMGFAADETALIAMQMQGAFQDTGKALEASASIIRASLITGLPTRELTDSLTAAAISYSSPAKGVVTDIEDITDKAIGLEERFGVLASESIKAFGDISSVATTAGLDLDEVGALLGVIQQRSGRSTSAITEGLGRILPAIQQSSVELLGLYNSQDNLAGSRQSISEAIGAGENGQVLLQLVRDFDRLDKSTQNYVRTLLGGRREAQLLDPLFGGRRDLIDELEREAGGDEGNTERRVADIQQRLSRQLAMLREEITQVADALAQAGLLDALVLAAGATRVFVGVIGTLVRALAELDEFLGGGATRLIGFSAAMWGITRAATALTNLKFGQAALATLLGLGGGRGRGAMGAARGPVHGPFLPGFGPGSMVAASRGQLNGRAIAQNLDQSLGPTRWGQVGMWNVPGLGDRSLAGAAGGAGGRMGSLMGRWAPTSRIHDQATAGFAQAGLEARAMAASAQAAAAARYPRITAAAMGPAGAGVATAGLTAANVAAWGQVMEEMGKIRQEVADENEVIREKFAYAPLNRVLEQVAPTIDQGGARTRTNYMGRSGRETGERYGRFDLGGSVLDNDPKRVGDLKFGQSSVGKARSGFGEWLGPMSSGSFSERWEGFRAWMSREQTAYETMMQVAADTAEAELGAIRQLGFVDMSDERFNELVEGATTQEGLDEIDRIMSEAIDVDIDAGDEEKAAAREKANAVREAAGRAVAQSVAEASKGAANIRTVDDAMRAFRDGTMTYAEMMKVYADQLNGVRDAIASANGDPSPELKEAERSLAEGQRAARTAEAQQRLQLRQRQRSWGREATPVANYRDQRRAISDFVQGSDEQFDQIMSAIDAGREAWMAGVMEIKDPAERLSALAKGYDIPAGLLNAADRYLEGKGRGPLAQRRYEQTGEENLTQLEVDIEARRAAAEADLAEAMQGAPAPRAQAQAALDAAKDHLELAKKYKDQPAIDEARKQVAEATRAVADADLEIARAAGDLLRSETIDDLTLANIDVWEAFEAYQRALALGDSPDAQAEQARTLAELNRRRRAQSEVRSDRTVAGYETASASTRNVYAQRLYAIAAAEERIAELERQNAPEEGRPMKEARAALAQAQIAEQDYVEQVIADRIRRRSGLRRNAVDRARDLERAAKRELDLARQRFKAGEIDISQLNEFQDAYELAQRGVEDAVDQSRAADNSLAEARMWRDPVGQARTRLANIDAEIRMREARDPKDESLKQLREQRIAAERAVFEAEEARRRSIEELAMADTPTGTVREARQRLDIMDARIKRSRGNVTDTEMNNMLLERKRLNQAYLDSVAEDEMSQIDYRIAVAQAAGDTAAVLRLGVEKAQAEVARLRSKGYKDTDKPLRDALARELTAIADERYGLIGERLSDLSFLYDMERITVGAYISELQGILATIPETKKELRQQIERQIKQLQDEQKRDRQWNIGDIDLPTLYEVRRLGATRTAGEGYNVPRTVSNATDMRTIVVTNNNYNADDYAGAISAMTDAITAPAAVGTTSALY